MVDFGLKDRDGRPLDLNKVRNIVEELGGSTGFDIKHTDVLNVEMVVESVQPKRWMSKDCAVATVWIDQDRKLCLIASTVLAGQLLSVTDSLPLRVKIGKKGKRYLFTI